MKVYKLTRPEDYKGLFAESLVTDPAIQSNLMAFSEEKEFTFQDEEQRIIYAPALIPNKMIFRKDIQGEPAHVYFEKETIKELLIEQSRQGQKTLINVNHSADVVEGCFIFESWIVDDKQIDKSFKMGFDVPEGTLMRGYKIDNDAVWNDIKLGNLKGLSIEGQLFPEEVKLNKHDMNKKGLITLAIEAFKAAFKFADMTDYGNGFFGSSLELGSIISDKDGNPMANAEFEYEKNKYKTDDMGAISEIEPIEDAPAEPADDGKDAKILELETKIADLEAKLTEATATKMANEAVIPELEARLVKLESELIEARKIKPIILAEEVPYEKMTNAQKVKFNRNK